MAEEKVADSDDGRADRHQPASAIAIHQGADQRCETGADDSLSGTEQREYAARNRQLACQRFEKDAECACERERRCNIGEKTDTDDVPAIENPLTPDPVLAPRCRFHPLGLAGIGLRAQFEQHISE